jgi:DNA helicase II / ATP-dependent DNA helicase PcrA
VNAILANLNPEQHRAVTLGRQSALVLAGAGSGKTRVLTSRIAYLVQSGETSPAGILAVTFTNKAAKEMGTRLAAMLPINTRGMWIGTFHGLCHRLLRTHWRDAGLPQTFQVLDSGDQLGVIKRLARQLGYDEDKFPPKNLQHFINGAKEEGKRAHQVEAFDSFARKAVEFYQAYDAQCVREGVVDFAELLLRSFELLAKNTALLTHYRERFRFILVDEFQDTNRLQYAWIKTLAGPTGVVFAVGDDDQSIYRFRGADVGNMREFVRDFEIADPIRLEQNYRSQGNILDAANAVISHNADRLGKKLWTDAGAGEPIRVFNAFSDEEEAQFIVDEVRQLHREGMALSDMALLYRSNAQSRILEHRLISSNVAYRVYGGLRFFERQEIKHALAYLRLAANPEDDGAFLRVVNVPARGVGTRSVEQLGDAARQAQVSLMRAAKTGALGGRGGSSMAGFCHVVDLLANAAARLPLEELMEEVVERSGLKAHYENEKDGADRLANLGELVNAAATFRVKYEGDDQTPVGVLAAFLTSASLEAGEHEAAAGQDALQLMTVHAAKGLEFHVVFLGGLEEGLFPHDNSVNEAGGLEEERRLMYVAITRARKRLYLSYAGSRMLHGQTRYPMASRFLEEIPENLVKFLQPPDHSTAYGTATRGTSERDRFGYGGGQGNAWQRQRSTPGQMRNQVPAASGRWDEFKAGLDSDAIGRRSVRMGLDRDTDTGAGARRAQYVENTGASTAKGFAVGQNVRHAKFGDGVIIGVKGRGSDAQVEVKFRASGVKILALQYAKLEGA